MIRHLAAALLAAVLCAPSTAQAQLASKQAGVFVQASGGLGVGDAPFTPGVGWMAAIGGWTGKYDTDFSLGRHVGFAAVVRQDIQLNSDRRLLRTAPMFQVHRGIDLLVVGVQVGAAAGPLMVTTQSTGTEVVGATARVVGAVKYRFRPRWGLLLRLEAGLDIERSKPQPALGLTIGLAFASPTKKK
jgi:hypothetical protein